MPKDEFDFEDPLELNGVAFLTSEDTMEPMAECFVEEFLRLGHNHKQILALFRNPHYIGLNMVLQNKGEGFVKEIISGVFARRGKKIEWPGSSQRDEAQSPSSPLALRECQGPAPAATTELDEKFTDPLGNPVPKLNL